MHINPDNVIEVAKKRLEAWQEGEIPEGQLENLIHQIEQAVDIAENQQKPALTHLLEKANRIKDARDKTDRPPQGARTEPSQKLLNSDKYRGLLAQYVNRYDPTSETTLTKNLERISSGDRWTFLVYQNKYCIENGIAQKIKPKELGARYHSLFNLYNELGDVKEDKDLITKLRTLLLTTAEKSLAQVPADLQPKVKIIYLNMLVRKTPGEGQIAPQQILRDNAQYFKQNELTLYYDAQKNLFTAQARTL